MKPFAYFILAVSAFNVIGCKPKKNSNHQSNINVIGGKAAETSEFPFVIKLVLSPTQPEMCTGIIVGPRTVIAASHCIKQESSGTYINPIAIFQDQKNQEQKISSKQVFSFTKSLNAAEIDEADVGLDFAILDFPPDSANPTGPFSFLPFYPKLGQPTLEMVVTLVGYGATELNAETTGKKNYGYNKISSLQEKMGTFKILGDKNASFYNALSTRGDSGGPVLSQDGQQLIGLSSAIFVDQTAEVMTNYFVDLNSKHIQTLMGYYKASIEKTGFKFTEKELLGSVTGKSFDDLLKVEKDLPTDLQWSESEPPKKLQPTCALIKLLLLKLFLSGNNNGQNNGKGGLNPNSNISAGAANQSEQVIQVTKNWPYTGFSLAPMVASRGTSSRNNGKTAPKTSLNEVANEFFYYAPSKQPINEVAFNKFTSGRDRTFSVPLATVDQTKPTL